MTPRLRLDKRTNTLKLVNARAVATRLTPEQRLENKRSWTRKRNAAKRIEYSITKAPPCQRCGRTLLMCECPVIGLHVAEYRDVVMVLDVRTMTKKIEIR